MNKIFKRIVSLLLVVFTVLGCAVFASAEEAVTYGDVTKDGKINSSDALAVLKHAVQTEVLDEAGIKAADVDADGIVNSSDALSILQYSVGKIKVFPLEVKVPMPQSKAEILALYTKVIKETREEVPAYKLKITSRATDVELSGSATSFMPKDQLEAEKESLMKETVRQNFLSGETALANLPAECKITDPSKFKDITCKQLDNANYQIDIFFKDEKDPKAGSPIVTMLNLPDKAQFIAQMDEELDLTMGGSELPVSMEVKKMEYVNCSISCVIDVRTGKLVSFNSTSDTVSSVDMYILIYKMTTDSTARTTLAYSNFVFE